MIGSVCVRSRSKKLRNARWECAPLRACVPGSERVQERKQEVGTLGCAPETRGSGTHADSIHHPTHAHRAQDESRDASRSSAVKLQLDGG